MADLIEDAQLGVRASCGDQVGFRARSMGAKRFKGADVTDHLLTEDV
jgi:hypothetical protein